MKKLLFLLLTFLISSSCKKEKFEITNLNGNKIIALGHAGMGITSTYPMNSCESVLKCLNIGMNGSEFDVQMTRDSVLVLFHDQELSDRTNLKGHINSHDWKDLKNAHYTSLPYMNYSIVSLDSLLSGIENLHQYKFTFDCKWYNNNEMPNYYDCYTNAVVKIIQKYQLEDNVFIESPVDDVLRFLKNKNPKLKLFIVAPSFEFGLEKVALLQLYGISIASKKISKEQIKMAHDNSISVAVWNVHTFKENKEAILKSPDFIQTDKAKNLLHLLKQ